MNVPGSEDTTVHKTQQSNRYRQGGHARIQGRWEEGQGNNNTQQYTTIKYLPGGDAQIQRRRDGFDDLVAMPSSGDIIRYTLLNHFYFTIIIGMSRCESIEIL